MNPSCPECHTELNEDFGIVTCSSCGAVCSVDLDGEAVVQEKNENLEMDALNDLTSSENESNESLEEVGINEPVANENLEETSEEFLLEDEEDSFDDLSLDAESNEQVSEFLEENDESDAIGDNEDESFTEEHEAQDDADEKALFEEEVLESSKPAMSASKFFSGLEVFTEQLAPMDYHHTYYQVTVSGFETREELSDAMELTLDERLGLFESSLVFDDARQSFKIDKISFLRLVMLNKRLSSLNFVNIDWILAQDQTDVEDSDEELDSDENTAVGEPLQEEDQPQEELTDDDLYEEVEEDF